MHGDETERGSQGSGADAGAAAGRRRAAPLGAISMTMPLYYRALAVQIAQGRSHAGACVWSSVY